ncbi:hypothetical protein [Mycobacterium riyadhense]|uniref:hypothetical protein n=1 Tax=Mycobacterium riyadhense TaxID=486698 RepID=UPI00195A5DE7|nr:hypothetical protein [Mycobacterium riyadhense]
MSKIRLCKGLKKYDQAATPYRRAEAPRDHQHQDKAILADTTSASNPAAVQLRSQALTSELLAITTSKAAPKTKAPVEPAPRAHP